MGHGGARLNSGRKRKYEDSEQDTRPVRIPNEISDAEIDEFVREKLREQKEV